MAGLARARQDDAMSVPPPDTAGYVPAPAPYRTYPDTALQDVSDLTRTLEPADPYAATITGFQPQANAQVVVVQPGYTPPAAAATPRPSVGLFRAIRLLVVNGTNFTGRASRSEFWLGTLGMVLGFFLWVVGLRALSDTWYWVFGWFEAVDLLVMAGVAVGAALIIPHASLTVRRLHDIGHSGALWFLHCLPGIGTVILAALCAGSSHPAGARFDDPRRPPQE
jgi:uncharacterized membrane protein YhaH (DUF805 family)